MIKNISVIEFEKCKKVQVLVNEPMTFGELFDVAMELRQFAVNGINELAKQDAPQSPPPVAPEAESVPQE